MLPLAAISALFALLLFIVWDRKRMSSSQRDVHKSLAVIHGTAESSSRAVKLLLGLALVMASIGIAEYFNPSKPPFTGRYSLFKLALFEHFGAMGLTVFWFAISAALVLIARSIWRHTPKNPPQS